MSLSSCMVNTQQEQTLITRPLKKHIPARMIMLWHLYSQEKEANLADRVGVLMCHSLLVHPIHVVKFHLKGCP